MDKHYYKNYNVESSRERTSVTNAVLGILAGVTGVFTLGLGIINILKK